MLAIRGLPAHEAAALRADARVAEAVAALAPDARVVVSDDNGSKGGPAIRCAVTVRLPHRGRVHVEARSVTGQAALDGALTRLRRRLARTVTAARAARRRPKKYYAARAITG